MLITAGLLWYVIFWLSKPVRHRDILEVQTKQELPTSGLGVFIVVFFAILSDGFDLVIFLLCSF